MQIPEVCDGAFARSNRESAEEANQNTRLIKREKNSIHACNMSFFSGMWKSR